MKQTYKITGMHCEHCAKRVEECLSTIPNVEKVKVNLKKNEAIITSKEEITLAMVNDSLKEEEFKATL